MSASHLQTVILSATKQDDLQRALDEWLDAHIADEVVSMQFAASGEGDGILRELNVLIVYKGERRVRRR